MQIEELDSYNLSDAVRFHDKLNPALWEGMKMRPEVRTALLKIAHDFREFMGINDIALKDITVSGSNAAFSYTPKSDIDLHLLVDMDKLDPDEVYRELFNAKKYQYNDQHNIKIRGYDVELYVQDAAQPVKSLGEYSLINDDWTHIPVKRRANLDDGVTKNKYEKLGHFIELALNSDDLKMVETVKNIIKRYRQAGLDEHGEFGPENLAFKILRSQGAIQQLFDHLNALKDQELSLKEKAPAQPVVYGFKTVPKIEESPDGTGPSTKQICEKEPAGMKEIIQDFVDYCVDELKIERAPNLKIRHDPQWSKVNHTFGKYTAEDNVLQIGVANRHIMDILRTVAHELTHQRQHEVQDVPPDAGDTGSSHENVANAMAGILMRNYGRAHPEHFVDAPLDEETLGSSTLGAMEETTDISEVRLRPRLSRALLDKGYRQVGEGSDKTVWIKDQGPAILILMPEEKIDAAATTALNLMKLSFENPDNPFLPKFIPMSDPETGEVSRVSRFNFDGETYYQIAMEKLNPLKSRFWDDIIDEFNTQMGRERNYTWESFVEYLNQYSGSPINRQILNFMRDPESTERMKLLFNTIKQLRTIGGKRKWSIDIRPANIMQRDDGTPVIVDPWYTTKISQGHSPKRLYKQVYAKEDSVEEGWKDAALGLGMLAGLGAASDVGEPKDTAPVSVSGTVAPAAKSLSKVRKVDPATAKQVLVTKAKQAGIHGKELQHLVSQAAHETLNFNKMIEMDNPERFAQYEKISSLGNTQPGDGGRYRGRGYLQITGRYNYQKFGKILGLPLEQQPELLENPEIAADAAIAYWKKRVQPKVKNWNKATVKQVTKPINPKLAGLKSRAKQFSKVTSIKETPVELTERYINIVDQPGRAEYIKQIWPLILQTYTTHGSGKMYGADPDDLVNTDGIWKVVRRGGKIVAGIIYRDAAGRKVRLVFHDGSPQGKNDLKHTLTTDILHGRSWGEFSGALEQVMMKMGARAIPNTDAAKILNKPIAKLDSDGIHYWREVHPGEMKRQVLLGLALSESASGYIPTKKQARDPRFKMALTQDIKPGELGRQANKFKLNVDSQGHPDLLDKNIQNLLREYAEFQRLDEVGMRPKELEAWARSPEAQGIIAGFEAEVVFNDIAQEEDETEADYDEDREPHDIEDICSFFDDSDFNSRSDIRRLREQLQDGFREYLEETADARWNSDEGTEFLNDYAEDKFKESQEIIRSLTAQELSDDDIGKILENPDSDEYKKARDQAWQEFLEEIKEDAYRDFVEEVIESPDAEELELDFLRDDGIRMMSDVPNQYNVTWPYYTMGGEPDVPEWGETQRLAKTLSKVVDKDVIPSQGYAHEPRIAGASKYILEPDTSIDPDEGDAGLEIISPPQALSKTLDDLRKVYDFANQNGYTNSSTGLHMNISVPNMQNLDYTKLVLFTGDLHVLEQYKRTNNQYCKSVFSAMKNRLSSLAPETIKNALDQIKTVLDKTAEKVIGTDIQQNKYVSIHQKEGYIEFRSPGNDYLNKPYDELVSTMLRFARALTIASNPNLYREEYTKKLYKFLSSSIQQSGDELALFTNYKAGLITKDELKYLLQQRKVKRQGPTDTKEYVWNVISKSSYEKAGEFTSTNANANTAFDAWLQSNGVLAAKNRFFYELAKENFDKAPKPAPQTAAKPGTGYVPGTNYVPGSTQDIQQRRLAAQAQPGEPA